MIYMYARVSTDRQENGRDAQLDRLEQWAKGQGDTKVYVDEDVSAHSVRFQDRPSGKAIWDLLEPGDIVVATKMDRMFRRLADMATTIDEWRKLNIRLVLLDVDVDITTAHGRAFAGWSAVAAQYESELHGQRKREVYAHKRQTGQPYNTLRPFGWRAVKNREGKLAGWEPAPQEQELGLAILAMREEGMSWGKIASKLCLSNTKKPRSNGSPWYHVSDVCSLARAAKAGYPKLPQAFWRGRDCERRLHAMRESGFPL